MLSRRISASTILTYVLLTLGAIVVLFPFYYTIVNSFKPGSEIMNTPTQLPSHVTITGYAAVFQKLNVVRLFLNSIFLAGSITLLSTFLSALAAYAFSKIPFPGRDRVFGFMLMTMMIPTVLLLIPTYVLMYNIGWVGHFQALIVPSAVSVFNIFLLRQFMTGIPSELVEAARVDGASEIRIFLRIMLPLARPALAAVAILTFIGSWNDFFGPLLYLNRPELYTLQLGLLQFRGGILNENAEQIWALTALITVPVVVVYFFMQEQFVKAFANVSLSK